MTIYTFPDVEAQDGEFGLISNDGEFSSPLSGDVQTIERVGRRFGGMLMFQNLSEDDSAAIKAFLLKLGGMSGRFYLGDKIWTQYGGARGALGGTPLVDGADQVGTMLNTKGWDAGVIDLCKIGDYLHFDAGGQRHFHMIVADADSNAGGLCSLEIRPPIRISPADDAAVEFVSPAAVMMLKDNEQMKWAHSKRRLQNITIEFKEAYFTP